MSRQIRPLLAQFTEASRLTGLNIEFRSDPNSGLCFLPGAATPLVDDIMREKNQLGGGDGLVTVITRAASDEPDPDLVRLSALETSVTKNDGDEPDPDIIVPNTRYTSILSTQITEALDEPDPDLIRHRLDLKN